MAAIIIPHSDGLKPAASLYSSLAISNS